MARDCRYRQLSLRGLAVPEQQAWVTNDLSPCHLVTRGQVICHHSGFAGQGVQKRSSNSTTVYFYLFDVSHSVVGMTPNWAFLFERDTFRVLRGKKYTVVELLDMFGHSGTEECPYLGLVHMPLKRATEPVPGARKRASVPVPSARRFCNLLLWQTTYKPRVRSLSCKASLKGFRFYSGSAVAVLACAMPQRAAIRGLIGGMSVGSKLLPP